MYVYIYIYIYICTYSIHTHNIISCFSYFANPIGDPLGLPPAAPGSPLGPGPADGAGGRPK